MKLPPESKLSREQREVMNAPTEGTTLVVGPPGSGKTVVAVLRERALKKREERVSSVVFNKVLCRYTGNELTFHRWLNQWWRSSTNAKFPDLQHTSEDGETQWQLDYSSALEQAKGSWLQKIKARGHWGHLILDEAQDFPPDAHRLLFVVQQRVFNHLPDDEKPSVCLLADENQRLTAHNSTLAQIRTAYPGITPDDEYVLRRNYRNTKQIAEFAAHFHVGLESGRPDLPTSEGNKPHVLKATLDAAVDRVVTFAKNNPDQEIGVLVRHERTRKKFFNKLAFRLQGSDVKVQTYSSQVEAHKDASKLKFEKPGTITILCFASSKGLEFDTVFLPELQNLPLGDGQPDQIRMNMYVMASRARRELWLTIDDDTGTHGIWELLPPKHLWTEE
jgi:superfamily I DNA/RNA helicase